MRKCPCHQCADRTVTCHFFGCRHGYKEWRKELDELNRLKRLENDKYSDPKRPRKYKNMIERIRK